MRRGVIKHCKTCNKEFYLRPSRINMLFCSRICYGQSLKGIINIKMCEARKEIRGKLHPFYGKHLSDEHKLKIKIASLGIHKGIKSGSWRGGVNPINDTIRKSQEYILWRIAVFMRDNYTCVKCGEKGYVQADHIKPFSLYPELRFAIDNGQTLCRKCHSIKTSQDMVLMRKEKPLWKTN